MGLPKQAVGWSLSSFNAGVEIGQASIPALALPILATIRHRSEPTGKLVTRFAAVTIAPAGTIWFVGRVWV